jgi:hypothetical protein
MKRSRSTLYRRSLSAQNAAPAEEVEEADVPPEHPLSLLAPEQYSQPVYPGSQLKVILVVLLLIYFRLKSALSDIDFLELLTINSLLWLPNDHCVPLTLYKMKGYLHPLLKKVNFFILIFDHNL